jgi:4-alpha-glucanotransferase
VSRLYRSALYLEIEAIPEFAECAAGGERVQAPGGASTLAALRGADHLDYAEVMATKRPVLERLHRHFATRHRDRHTPRGRAYADYLAREGEPLDDFAAFSALAESFSRQNPDRRDWHRWPAAYRSPRSAAVSGFRRENPEALDFHRWVQFELDRQLGEAARRARERRLSVGLYTDLALGSDSRGSDAWAFPGLFAENASAGAPPDEFSAQGQDWAFPPLDPHRLRRGSYDYWIRLLRAAFAHAGALRIDHAMGLARLYWIPKGRPATEGAYIRYPEADLLGILALESHRHGALVIGEDLGTVPRGLVARLARRGILSSRVLYFERAGGSFRSSRSYSNRALVSANTHDLVPLAGFLSGRDLEMRRRVGQLESDGDLREAMRERDLSSQALFRRLEVEGVLQRGTRPPSAAQFAVAVAAFLSRTPAPLVAIALDDLGGEEEPVNLPGVGPDRHPSWTRRMKLELEALASSPEARAGLRAARR